MQTEILSGQRKRRSPSLATGLALMLGCAALPLMAASAALADDQTDVGTPRAQTLIVDMLNARVANPTDMNTYQQGVIDSQGLHQMATALLWDIDTAKGKQIPDLAADMPIALDKTFTDFKVPLRQGLTWSDGQPFTADDVVFTADMIRNTPALAYSAAFTDAIASVTKLDDHTVEIKTTRPTPRLSVVLGSVIYGNGFVVVPKHIWQSQNAATFSNFPPVTISAYKYQDEDPNGTWFLWKKRDDWKNSDVGQIIGEPAPEYVLFRSYGTEEHRVLAMASNDMDILTDVSPESLDTLRQQNKNVHAWSDKFPYANMSDPCERGMHFNDTTSPYDKWQTRWALALATDLQQTSIATFSGMLRASPLGSPPTDVLMKTYDKPMATWLANFQLPDGYKPFDPDYATKLADTLRSQGIQDLPTDPDKIKDLFGVGWWKHDPQEATKLLLDAGLKQQDGKWMTPDGKPWTITINAPADFEVELQRLAFAVANEWNSFGIPTNVQQMQAGAFFTAANTGNYTVGSYWGGACAIIPDLFVSLEGWHKDYVRPTGTPASSNNDRFSDDQLSASIDKLRAMQTDDPHITDIGTEILQELVKDMPAINMFGTSKFVPVNDTYWTNYPTVDNAYEGPWWWWSNFKFIVAHIKPVQK